MIIQNQIIDASMNTRNHHRPTPTHNEPEITKGLYTQDDKGPMRELLFDGRIPNKIQN